MEQTTTTQTLPRLTLLARADESGLGYQTRDYYKWLKPHKTVIIDLSPLNGNKQHYDWYSYQMIVQGIPTRLQIHQILDDTDILLTAETAYNLELYSIAKDRGIKTICVENPEFYDHIKYPQYEMPSTIILPSVWREQLIREHAESRGTKVYQIHHPVDRSIFQFKQRTTGNPIHIAGKPASFDRNGTYDFLNAYPKGLVTTQGDDLAWNLRRKYRHSDIRTNVSQLEIYSMGDILVLPRRYGGNCLPLNEALSCGMPVIMPDIEPNNHILPKEWLVPATVTDHFEPRGRVDIYSCDINALRERIEWVRANIETESQKANEIANKISWETLLPEYERVIYE